MTDLLALTKPYKRAPTVANSKKWPQTVKARFIEPGLVDYTDLGLGMILVQRPFLDKVRSTFVGKPVIDAQHKDARPENFQEIADGVVIRVWNDPKDGWDWCEFLVWDEQTLLHTKDPAYFVSCAYDPTRVDRNAGKHHNIPYDGEFLDGSYTHLAVVKDPRYEGAKIVWNSTGAKPMNPLLKFFRRSEEVAELDPAATFLEIDGEKVSVENAVKIVRAQNKSAANGAMKDDDVLEIDGKKYSGLDIKNAVANAKKAKNSEGEKGEKAGDQEEAVEEEKESGKKRDKGEAKNAVMCEAHDKKDCEECLGGVKNSLKGPEAEKGKHLGEFREVAEMRNNQPGTPSISTMQDRLKAGMESYGKVKKDTEAA